VHRSAIICGVASAALMLGAAEASAVPTTLAGSTKESGKFRLVIDEQLRPMRAVVGWRARCGRGYFRTVTVLTFRTKRLDSGKLAVLATYPGRSQGYRYRVRLWLIGKEVERFQPNAPSSTEGWRGSVRAKVVVRKGGSVVTRCHLDKTSWVAWNTPRFPPDVPSGSLNMTSESGDWVGQGKTYAYSAPPGMIGDGFGNRLHFRIGDWWIDFGLPWDQTFTAKRYTGAVEWQPGVGPSLNISGHGRACSELTGEFTIHSIAYDQWGDLTAVHLSFVQRCETSTGSLRGTLVYRRSY
jgi:hypothetical protein